MVYIGCCAAYRSVRSACSILCRSCIRSSYHLHSCSYLSIRSSSSLTSVSSRLFVSSSIRAYNISPKCYNANKK